MPFTVYILKDRFERIYVGQTKNLKQRLLDHSTGRTKSLRGRQPFSVVHKEIFKNRVEAVKRERFLKSGQGRLWIKTQLLYQ